MKVGTPHREKKPFTIASATVTASWFGMGKASTHFVKQSVATRMYLFPFAVTGNGPTMSMVTRSIGCPTWKP
jgi:hypothetical protein